jgi:hypothetical protein
MHFRLRAPNSPKSKESTAAALSASDTAASRSLHRPGWLAYEHYRAHNRLSGPGAGAAAGPLPPRCIPGARRGWCAKSTVGPPARGGSCAEPRSDRARSTNRPTARHFAQVASLQAPQTGQPPPEQHSQSRCSSGKERLLAPPSGAASTERGRSERRRSDATCAARRGPSRADDRARSDRGSAQLPPRTSGATALSRLFLGLCAERAHRCHSGLKP